MGVMRKSFPFNPHSASIASFTQYRSLHQETRPSPLRRTPFTQKILARPAYSYIHLYKNNGSQPPFSLRDPTSYFPIYARVHGNEVVGLETNVH